MTDMSKPSPEKKPVATKSISEVKLPKRKQAWRHGQYEKCIYKPLEDGQVFAGGRKVILWYPSHKVAEGGYVDAEWSGRIEIHHMVDNDCVAYYTDRQHDAITFEDDWRLARGKYPHPHSFKIQRDGAAQLLMFDDFSFHDYQAAEIRYRLAT